MLIGFWQRELISITSLIQPLIPTGNQFGLNFFLGYFCNGFSIFHGALFPKGEKLTHLNKPS